MTQPVSRRTDQPGTFDRARALAVRIEPLTVRLERGRIAFFSRTIGEEPGVHTLLAAARAAGHPDLVVPPTFFFSVQNEMAQPFGDLAPLGIDPARALHGEQAFTYDALVFAGETLEVSARLVDAFTKKGGALQIVVRASQFRRGSQVVATETSTLVIPQEPTT